MKKLLLLLLLVLMVASPAISREAVKYNGTPVQDNPTRTSDIELEYDGGVFVAYGMSPNWTDFTVVNFEIPDGGPFMANEIRYYCIGSMPVFSYFMDGGGLSDPPTNPLVQGPQFTPCCPAPFPPADWTTVNVAGLQFACNTGDIVRPGIELLGTDFGLGMAYAFDDGNPGHSWALWSGAWTDDTYGYGYDDGIRLGINIAGGTPVQATTWGGVKNLYR